MLCNDELYKKKVMDNIYDVYQQDLLPRDHVIFLENVLHKKFNIKPQIIYVIGSAVLHFERHAKRIWPDSKIYCFDCFSPYEELYQKTNVNYNMCCLSNVNNLEVKYYQNDLFVSLQELNFHNNLNNLLVNIHHYLCYIKLSF